MNYAVSEFKPILESPHRLAEPEEASGKLLSVSCRDGFAVASFSWGAISLPEEMREQLEPLVGKTVCILRLDGYHVRAVD